jgi:arylsulfatase A-like enzyme
LIGVEENQKRHEFLYWEYKEEQAVRMGNWYGYRDKPGNLEIYDLEKNPEQDKDLSGEHPQIADKIAEIMKNEHTPSDVWPSPGESEEEFKQRMIDEGIGERPENIAEF